MCASLKHRVLRAGTVAWHELVKLTRFGLVGVAATAVHVLVAGAVLKWSNHAVFAANLIGFLVAFQVSFFGHRYITFQTRGHWRRFIAIALLGFLLNNSILAGLVVGAWLDGWPAIVFSTLCVPAVMYLLLRGWVFAGC